jgi:uncharacterized RDD family membrane protein YckC
LGRKIRLRKVSGLIRILSFIADYIIVSLPIIVIMVMYFKVSDSQAELLFKLLFAAYGTLFMEYMNGATIGKRFGRIRVVTMENGKPTLVEYGMRELVKTLYFIPMIGWVLAAASSIMQFIKDGRTLHDYIAKTKVIYLWEQQENKDEL